MSGSLIYAAGETEVSLAMHIFVRAVMRARPCAAARGTLRPRNNFAYLITREQKRRAKRPCSPLPHRVGAGRGGNAVLLSGATAGADRADQSAIDDDRHAALRGDGPGIIREAHEPRIAGCELVGEHLAGAAKQRGGAGFRQRQLDGSILGTV